MTAATPARLKKRTAPLRRKRPEAAAPQPSAAALRILLLEDSAADIELVTHLLMAALPGVVVVDVVSEEGFVAELSRRPPHLILSDYAVPVFDGIRALEIAQQLAPHIPFIFVTGTLGEEVAIDMLKRGATDYVLKSRLTRLVPAVSRALVESKEKQERARAEERLRRSHDQLRSLTNRLQGVREVERSRIAREVHDGLGQALTGLKLELVWVARKYRRTRGLQKTLRELSGRIDETIQAVRRIATELRPGVLDSLGLVAAIEWQAAEFQKTSGIPCRLKIGMEEDLLEAGLSTACFRIFQEALTNISRHAGATQVDVELRRDGNELVLTVQDNGKGITDEEIGRPESIGLRGMQERAAQAGGSVVLHGTPKQGTQVMLRAPLTAAGAQGQKVALGP